jgi:hypothetical protein
MPRATLMQTARFTPPILAVSFASAGAPNFRTSAADISSVTVEGVSHITSGYSITRRTS